MQSSPTLLNPKKDSAFVKRLGRLVAGLSERMGERNPSNYERRQDKAMCLDSENYQTSSAIVCAQKNFCAQKFHKLLLLRLFFGHKIKSPNNSRGCECF